MEPENPAIEKEHIIFNPPPFWGSIWFHVTFQGSSLPLKSWCPRFQPGSTASSVDGPLVQLEASMPTRAQRLGSGYGGPCLCLIQ